MVWERGTVEHRSESGGVVAMGVRLEGSDALWECDFASPGALDAAIKPCNNEKPLAVPDLIALTHLHEAAILDVVRSRAAAGVIYTAVGHRAGNKNIQHDFNIHVFERFRRTFSTV